MGEHFVSKCRLWRWSAFCGLAKGQAPAWGLWPWIAFLLTLTTYWLTVDPGASYWDCPEYLVSALRLEVGHPPGNPTWTLTHRFITLWADIFLPEGRIFNENAMNVSVMVINMMSGLFTALASMILCSVCITLMRWAVKGERGKGNDEKWRRFIIGLSALTGSLCFGWCDSAWYSAVEAEVYAMSIFLTALTVWMALKWYFAFSRAARARWLIAMAYVMGLSIGVHQLNLLAIPAIALIMSQRAASRPVGRILPPVKLKQVRENASYASTEGRIFRENASKRGLLALLAGCAVTGFILLVLMPYSLRLAAKADILAVNNFGLPYWSGAIAFWTLSLTSVTALAIIIIRKHYNAGVALWSLAAVMLGFSVYILIPIRAAANPPVNTGSPSSPMRFADYLDRRQYGGAPLFRGRTPFSEVMRLERITVSPEGDTVWDYSQNALRMIGRDYRPVGKDARIPMRSRFLTNEDRELNSRLMADSAPHGYAVAGFRLEEIHTPELDMWLPRIHSGAPGNFTAYGDWTGMDSANMVKVRVSEAIDSLGNPVPRRGADGRPIIKESMRPTYLQNLTYLLGYQTGYMYLRYLMWNFSGRQNDMPSTGEIDHGNFITGYSFIDNQMLGDQRMLPRELGRDNPGHAVLGALPFLLALYGIWFLAVKWPPSVDVRRRKGILWATLVLFLMTGLAIVFYLNQTPGEPRERDYSFLGSFWTFCIWIAFGAWHALLVVGRLWPGRKKIFAAAVALFCIIPPALMLLRNYPSHDRSGRSATLDYASNLLESMPEDTILIVDGDNYIFPLWFAQEVMGIRRDVNVICDAYLGSDWYVGQLMTPGPDNDGVRMTAREGDIIYGNCNIVRLPSSPSDPNVGTHGSCVLPAVDALKALYSDTAPIPRFPVRYLKMGKDSTDSWVFDLLSIPGKSAGSIATLREAALIDIIATNAASRYPRPIYWHDSMRKEKYRGFFPFTRQGLYARRLLPLASSPLTSHLSPLTSEALDALPKLKFGGADSRMRYAGPDVAAQVSGQRAALTRLAQALLKEGRPDQALHVAMEAYVRFPSDVAPFMLRHHIDSTYREAPELARVLTEAGTLTGDSLAVAIGKGIMEEEEARNAGFRRYYESLPPSRRGAVSPVTRARARE